MTYGLFLALFLGIPLLLLGFGVRRTVTREMLLLLAILAVVALLYTAPWDNAIVVNGVWSYSRHQIVGAVIGHVPLEEYVFYVLQVCLTGLVTCALLQRRGWKQ